MSVRQEQRTFVLRVTPMRGVDPIRSLRGLLKTMLRRFGLRCVAVEEITELGAKEGD